MSNELNRAKRWFRIIRHQHDLSPFKQEAVLSILEDFELERFRRQLGRKCKGLELVVFIELAIGATRPHFHVLIKTPVTKQVFRRMIERALSGQRFKLEHEAIREEDKLALFTYITKATPKLQEQVQALSGRNVFTVGKPFDKSTAELSRLTPKERARALIKAAHNPKLATEFIEGKLTHEQISHPQFLYWWVAGKRPEPEDPTTLDNDDELYVLCEEGTPETLVYWARRFDAPLQLL